MARLGIAFWPDAFSIEDMLRCGRKVDEKGYESIWIPEHYYLFKDAFSSLAAISLVTRRIKLGTGVVNPYTRHPVLIAMSIAALDELSGGRAILGIGTGVRFRIEEQMAVRMEKPILAMKETIQIIRQLLTGENVTYEGRVFTIRNMKLEIKPPLARIPIYMAAIGPNMLQSAGEVADGVILTAGSSLKYVRTAIENIKIGAHKAHRDLSQIDVATFLICSVSDDGRAAKDATRELVAYLLTRQNRAALMLEKEDFNDKILNDIRKELQKGNLKQAAALVTEPMIDSTTISGTPQECKQKIQEYMDAHITLPIITLMYPTDLTALDLIGKV